jgi:response regulator RpfG family c-di-GMP phosphodiesterase
MALAHHERWNGTGYLYGLEAMAIPNIHGRQCEAAKKGAASLS